MKNIFYLPTNFVWTKIALISVVPLILFDLRCFFDYLLFTACELCDNFVNVERNKEIARKWNPTRVYFHSDQSPLTFFFFSSARCPSVCLSDCCLFICRLVFWRSCASTEWSVQVKFDSFYAVNVMNWNDMDCVVRYEASFLHIGRRVFGNVRFCVGPLRSRLVFPYIRSFHFLRYAALYASLFVVCTVSDMCWTSVWCVEFHLPHRYTQSKCRYVTVARPIQLKAATWRSEVGDIVRFYCLSVWFGIRANAVCSTARQSVLRQIHNLHAVNSPSIRLLNSSSAM